MLKNTIVSVSFVLTIALPTERVYGNESDPWEPAPVSKPLEQPKHSLKPSRKAEHEATQQEQTEPSGPDKSDARKADNASTAHRPSDHNKTSAPASDPAASKDNAKTNDNDSNTEKGENNKDSEAETEDTEAEEDQIQPISLLDSTIAPGTFRTLYWAPGLSMSSLNTPVPVLIAHGTQPGPKMCLTAAIHGDELNGIEIVRRVLHQIDPGELSGSVIGMPIVNLDGFRRASRYMSDRRDLNRFFPGNANGSYASRVAHSLFHKVILHCDYLVDIHTASFKRTNLPQLRGDLKNNQILDFSRHFGGLSVLHHPGGLGTLRRAAADSGIPAITMETGGPHKLEPDAVNDGVKGVKNMLHNLGMYKTVRLWLIPQPVFYQSIWIRASQGGILLSKVKLAQKVNKGDLLGRIVDPITNTSSEILSPFNGIILGKAVDQVVSPGFATFHLGEIATEEELAAPKVPAKVIAPDLEETKQEAPALSPPPLELDGTALQDIDS